MKRLTMLFLLLLPACSPQVNETPDTVILINRGEMKISPVKKFGVYCTASWYRSFGDTVLRPDGTAVSGPFDYRWTLNEAGAEADKIWYGKTCKELK